VEKETYASNETPTKKNASAFKVILDVLIELKSEILK